MRLFFLLLVATPLWADAASVFKCTDAQGKTVFSGHPCAADAQAVDVKASSPGSSQVQTEAWKAQRELDNAKQAQAETRRRYAEATARLANAPCREFKSTELRTMIIRNQVAPGMALGDALKAWGKPTNGGGWQNAYHWDNGASAYFYIKNGCVESVQGTFKGR